MAFRYRSNRLALACSTVLVTACSLGNPYVVREAGDPRQNFCVDRNQCTVAEAKSSAFELAQLYRNKLSAHARMEAAVGAGGIVLGSAVLALAIADAHPDAYGAAGVIGATVYGLNTWYSNKPREEIYAKGLLALSCAATAVRAVDVPTTERAKLRDTAKVLAAISGVSDAARRLLADANAGMGSAEERVQAAAMLEQAQADLTAASVSLDAAAKLDSAASGAGNALMDSVDAIGAAVDDALRKTVPEGSLAIKIGSSLGDIAGKIVPGWDVKVAMPSSAKSGASAQSNLPQPSMSASLLVLSGKLIDLQLALSGIRGVLANFNGSGISTGLDACKLLGLSALSVLPAEIAFTAGTAASASVVINNGKPPYSATTVGATAPGLELKNPLPFDRRLDISITAATPAARHTVLVSDANGNGVSLFIDIKKAASPPPPAASKDTSSTKTPVEPKATTLEALVSAMNQELGNTRLLGGKYVVENFTVANGVVTINLRDGKKLDAAERKAAQDEMDNWSVLNRPFPEQLKDFGLEPAFPL